jgi:hypothetical protein
MSFRLSIMEKTSTLLDETIHTTLGCAVHLHGHQNKMVPFLKPSIFVDLNNGVKFCTCTCLLSNDIRNHCFLYRIRDHHINNENLVVSSHVEINF